MIRITNGQLARFAPHATPEAVAALTSDEASALLSKHGINSTALRLCHAWAQWAWETNGFTEWSENLHYSAAGLLKTFPHYFTHAQALYYAKAGPEAIANLVYDDRNKARRNKLGNTSDGDGWKFRGRGFMHSTGEDGYRRASEVTGIDLVADPDRLAEPAVSLIVACEFWTERGINKHADRNKIEAITRIVNGGYNGLDGRKELFAKAWKVFGAGNVADVPVLTKPGAIHEGATGDAVSLIQQRLTDLRYPVAVDGIYGPAMRKAILAFKSDNALSFTDATADDIDDTVRDKLFSAATHPADISTVRLEQPVAATKADPVTKKADLIGNIGKTLVAVGGTAGAVISQSSGQIAAIPSTIDTVKAWWEPIATHTAWLRASPWALAIVIGVIVWRIAVAIKHERAAAAANGQHVEGS